MKKKYLIKPPSSNPYNHTLDYTSLINHSYEQHPIPRHSHVRPTRPLPHRLVTEPAAEPKEYKEGQNDRTSKRGKRQGSDSKLMKGRYLVGGK